MQQIAEWLEKLGMSEYAQRFAENGIDVSVLRDLTNQELRQSAYCSAIAGPRDSNCRISSVGAWTNPQLFVCPTPGVLTRFRCLW